MDTVAVNVTHFRLAPTTAFLPGSAPTLGVDLAGVVTAVGDRCERLRVGHHVFGRVPTSTAGGSASRRVEVPEHCLLQAPEHATRDSAHLAALPTASLHAVFASQWMLPATRVAVVGAHTPSGIAVTQMAKARNVVSTSVEGLITTDDELRAAGPDVLLTRPRSGSGTQFDHLWRCGQHAPFDLVVLCCDPGTSAAKVWQQARHSQCTHPATRFVDLWTYQTKPWRALGEAFVENSKQFLRHGCAKYSVYWPDEVDVFDQLRHAQAAGIRVPVKQRLHGVDVTNNEINRDSERFDACAVVEW